MADCTLSCVSLLVKTSGSKEQKDPARPGGMQLFSFVCWKISRHTWVFSAFKDGFDLLRKDKDL